MKALLACIFILALNGCRSTANLMVDPAAAPGVYEYVSGQGRAKLYMRDTIQKGIRFDTITPQGDSLAFTRGDRTWVATADQVERIRHTERRRSMRLAVAGAAIGSLAGSLIGHAIAPEEAYERCVEFSLFYGCRYETRYRKTEGPSKAGAVVGGVGGLVLGALFGDSEVTIYRFRNASVKAGPTTAVVTLDVARGR